MAVRVTHRSQETSAQFHQRMIANCEAAAARFERRAAGSAAATTRERFFAKAAIERRNADHHRRLIEAMPDESMIGT